jgi:hypothetical protein
MLFLHLVRAMKFLSHPFRLGGIACALLSAPPLATADPVISEFMASNQNSISDEDGFKADWIEIHNPDSAPVNLEGWSLTDKAAEPREWIFPAVTLPANGYLIVFASNKDRRVPGQPLHTNFALSAGGEYLALIQPDGTTKSTEFSPGFPPQFGDISYGTAAGGEIGYFGAATPGTANGGPETLQLPQTVSYSRPAGPFTASFSLTLSGAAAGQEIRYVIADPSGNPNANVPEPAAASTLYTGPVTIASSKVIRAAVFNPVNGQHGGPKTVQYLLLETGATNNTSTFTSQLPIAVIDQHGGGGYGPGEPYKPSFFYLFDRNSTGTATLNSTPTLFSKIQNKVRGSTSANFPKRAYGMKTSNEANENEKKSLLGLAADSSWVWYNPWKYDDTYVHNAFMFQLSRDLGRWAPRTRPVEMFLNVNGGKLDYTDYNGVYVLTEKIKSGSNRLDLTSIAPADTTGDALTGAYIIKIDRADADETSWTTALSQVSAESKIVLVEPEQEDEKPEQVAYIKNYVNNFETALAADRAGNWQTRNYQKYIDVPSWIDVHLLNSFSLNPDSFRLSSYFHKDRNEKLKAGPIWDFDRALFADKDGTEPQDSPRQWNGTHFDMSWWREVWRDPEFIQAWVDRWWEIRGGAMSDEHLATLITTMGNEIGNTVGARDAARFPGTDGNAPESGSYLGEIAALRDWLVSSAPGNLGRTNWIDTQVPGPPSASLASGKVTAGTTITLAGAGSGETLRYRTNGLDPRPLGGADSNATIYSAALTINQTTVLKARRRKAANFTPFPHDLTTTWSAPLTRVYLVNEDFATAADLTVSEIHYDPASPTAAELAAGIEVTAGKFEYIELRNTGTRTVNTFGLQFVDGQPFKGLTLAPLTLQPGEFALVVKDRAAFLSRFGAAPAAKIVGEWGDGSLSNSGEPIKILARDGTTLYEAPYSANAPTGASLVNLGGGWKTDVPSPGKLGPTYAEWKAFYFPAGSTDLADPDGDGAGNLLEYSRGTNPLVAENQSSLIPTATLVDNGTTFKFAFTQPIDRPSAIWQVEISTDLTHWSTVGSTLVTTAAGLENRELTLSLAGGTPKRFLRLKISATP